MLGLGIAGALVVGAWFAVGRTGLETVGEGGVNRQLLPRVGEVAPDIEVTEVLTGGRLRLSDLRGRPVWLNFWGSWCGPCRAEMPELQAAWEELKPQGLVMLAISVRESPEQAWGYADRNNVTFPIFTDQYERDTGGAYPLYNVPTHVFIDAEGVIRGVVLADMDLETALENGRKAIAGAGWAH